MKTKPLLAIITFLFVMGVLMVASIEVGDDAAPCSNNQVAQVKSGVWVCADPSNTITNNYNSIWNNGTANVYIERNINISGSLTIGSGADGGGEVLCRRADKSIGICAALLGVVCTTCNIIS